MSLLLLESEAFSVGESDEEFVLEHFLGGVGREDELVETGVGLRQHVRVSPPAGYLEHHLTHATNGDAVTAGGEEEEELLLAHRHLAHHLPEPSVHNDIRSRVLASCSLTSTTYLLHT